MSRQAGNKRHNGSRFYNAAPQCVCDANVTRDDGLYQPGNTQVRIPSKLQWIAEIVVHTSENYMDLSKSLQRLQVHAPVTNRQVGTFDKGKAEIARQVRVLE